MQNGVYYDWKMGKKCRWWDLSKAFECIPRDIIISKLETYDFYVDALKLIHDYLTNRKQRVKVNDAYSLEKNIFYGFLQRSILVSLLFNMHLCNHLCYFFEELDITSYADDATISLWY